MPKKNFIPFILNATLLIVLTGCNAQSRQPGVVLQTQAKVSPWKFAGIDGYKITTPRYQLFTTTRKDFALRMAAFMEACADNYDSLTGLGPKLTQDGKTKYMKVYIFSDRQQWAKLTEKITGQSAGTALKIAAGGYCYKGICVFWDIGPVGTARVAAHEGMHQYLHHRLYHRLPAWADEGLAVMAEGFEFDRTGAVHFDYSENHGRKVTLRTLTYAHRGRSIKQLCSISSSDNLKQTPLFGTDYYTQLWALMNLVKSTESVNSAFIQMCKDAAGGKLREALEIPRPQWAQLQRDHNTYSQIVGLKTFERYILGASADTPQTLEQNFAQFSRELADIKN